VSTPEGVLELLLRQSEVAPPPLCLAFSRELRISGRLAEALLHRMPHLAAIDPITGERIRSSQRSQNRYEHREPGAMVHVDVKKLGRIPPGGGWRLHGREAKVSVANRHKKTKIGYDYVHTAIDDRTRLAYSEVLPDERDATCAEFLHRALAWFAGYNIRVRRVLTDNALVYRHGTDWGWVCTAWQLKRRFTKPGCPGRTGKPNGSTAPSSTNGPTPGPGPATVPAPAALTDSSPTTTLDAATPPSADTHPSAGSPPDYNVSGHDS
jgi:hypothetical protein